MRIESVKVEKLIADHTEALLKTGHRLIYICSFAKTFTINEFDSIYCEREWRSTKEFSFKLSDVAMIVLPREKGFYDDLVSKMFLLGLQGVPIVPWEDLIEH
jgi:hypothetical protein